MYHYQSRLFGKCSLFNNSNLQLPIRTRAIQCVTEYAQLVASVSSIDFRHPMKDRWDTTTFTLAWCCEHFQYLVKTGGQVTMSYWGKLSLLDAFTRKSMLHVLMFNSNLQYSSY